MNTKIRSIIVGAASLSSVSIAVAQTPPGDPAPTQPGAGPNAGAAGPAEQRNEDSQGGPENDGAEQTGAPQPAAAVEADANAEQTEGGAFEGEPTAPAIPAVDPGTPAGRFGAARQLAISSDAGLFIENTSQSGDDDSGSTTNLQLRPAFDYFVIDHLSIGGFVALDYSKVPAGDSTTWGIGPRIGYDIPLSDRFSIWPKVGFSFASTSTSTEVDSPLVDGDATSSNVALNLFAPVMFHPVEHFFLGFGPALDTDLSGDVKTTTIAGRLSIGGWLR